MKNMISKFAVVFLAFGPLLAMAECAPTTQTQCHIEDQTVVTHYYSGYASCRTPDGQNLSEHVHFSHTSWVTLRGSNGQSCMTTVPFSHSVESVVQKNVCTNVQVPPVYTAGCDIAKACTPYGTTSINNVSTFAVNAVSHCGACGTKTSIQTNGSSGTMVHFSCAQ